MKVNCLIVGQGLAGTLAAYRCIRQGMSVMVVDPGLSETSSRIAAGMFTPVSGKRMTLTPGAADLISIATYTYKELESWLQTSFLHEEQMYHAFGSVKEQNDLMSRMDNANFASWINLYPDPVQHVLQPYGAFEVKNGGWVDMVKFLDAFRDYLGTHHSLLSEIFYYQSLKVYKDNVHYQDLVADRVIFCEGYKLKDNPYFNHHEIIPCKGDVLEITCQQGPKDKILKKGCYMINTRGNDYRVGSTYLWHEDDLMPSRNGRETLKDKLNELIDLPFEMIRHRVGIRPTTKNRQPIIARHPEHRHLFALNGMGTKGVLHAPLWSMKLMDEIMKD